jgi:hypothetical protein
MEELRNFLVKAFFLLLILMITVFIVRRSQQVNSHQSQLQFLKTGDSYLQIESIKIDNFSNDVTRNIEYTQLYDIKIIMSGIFTGSSHFVTSRVGTYQYCRMQLIKKDGEIISLRLSKDDRSIVNVEYIPIDIDLLSRKTEDLCFLFSKN